MKRLRTSGGLKRAAAAAGKKRQRMKPATPTHCLSPFFISANQASAPPAGRPIRAGTEALGAGPGLPAGGRLEPARPAPPRPAPAPPRPAQAPPRPRPAAASRACLEPPGQRPAAGAEYCPKGRKETKAGRLGDSHVTGGGFTIFSFAVDSIAKCMEGTARPGQERERKAR